MPKCLAQLGSVAAEDMIDQSVLAKYIPSMHGSTASTGTRTITTTSPASGPGYNSTKQITIQKQKQWSPFHIIVDWKTKLFQYLFVTPVTKSTGPDSGYETSDIDSSGSRRIGTGTSTGKDNSSSSSGKGKKSTNQIQEQVQKQWVPFRCTLGWKIQFFQHFFVCIFSYVSTKLWQNHFYHDLSRVGVSYLEIDYSDTKYMRNNWTSSLVTRLSQYYGKPFISHEGCRHAIYNSSKIPLLDHRTKVPTLHNNTYFRTVHPLDLFRTTSLLLGENPCRLVNKSSEILARPLRVTILNRKGTRAIKNLDKVKRFLATNAVARNRFKIRWQYFEHLNFLEQVSVMEATDILVTVHGAGLTNAVFMSPCSVILEFLPYGYGQGYFDRIFSSHFLHHQHVSECDLDVMGAQCGENASRRDLCCPVEYRVSGHPLMRNLSGRVVLRGQKLLVNTTLLLKSLVEASVERKRCVMSNEMYTPR
jgi:hypothetical protein